MAVDLVVLCKIIDIKHHHGDSFAIALGSFYLDNEFVRSISLSPLCFFLKRLQK